MTITNKINSRVENLDKNILENIKNEINNFIKENSDIIKDILENKQKNVLRISDFDDTIFSLHERYITFPNLKGKRGEIGNKYVLEEIGIENFIKKIYKNKKFPKDIIDLLKEDDLILTAGNEELQKAKIKVCSLEHINLKVVEKSSQKILALLKYIFEELKYIPEKIIIYEDRPEYFIYFKENLEKILDTKIEIKYVKMENNEKIEIFGI